MLLQRKKESRDARSISLIRYAVDACDVRWDAFDPKEEARRRQNPPQPALDAGLETLFGPAFAIEPQHGLEILFSDRPPVRVAGEC
jgi:hypothetical protein